MKIIISSLALSICPWYSLLMSVSVRCFPLAILVIAGFAAAPVSRANTSVTTNPGRLRPAHLQRQRRHDRLGALPAAGGVVRRDPVASVNGSTVTVNGTSAWTTNQFVYSGSGSSSYYAQIGTVQFGTDPKDGSDYTVTANGTNSLTLNLNGDNIGSVPAGSTISVVPYWTLATVFPASTAGTAFISSTSPKLSKLATQILIPNYSGTGVNLSAAATYYFYNGAWELYGDTNSPPHVAGDDILINNGYFIARNPTATTATLTTMGNAVPD